MSMPDVSPFQASASQRFDDDPWDSDAPTFDPGAGHGYISSGELLAWLAVVGGNTYDDMRRQMIGSEQRNALQEDLGHLKSVIEEVQGTKELDKLEAEIRAVVDKYQGTELEERVNALFGERLAQFDALHAAETAEAAAEKAAQEAREKREAGVPVGQQGADEAAAMFAADRAREDQKRIHASLLGQLDSWKTDIEAKSDKLGTEDQLALIRIQELNSRITQATQLASNLLEAQDQAQSAAIMNLKG